MDCELEIGGDDGEPIQGFSLSILVSDGAVSCGECGRLISAGANYEHVTGECESEPFDNDTCPDCQEIANAFSDNGRMIGMLWYELEECGGQQGKGAFAHFTSGCLAKLQSPSAKSYLVERWLKWKGLPAPAKAPTQEGKGKEC